MFQSYVHIMADAKDAKIAELEQALRDSKRRCDALEELRVHLMHWRNYRVLRSEREQMRKWIGSCSTNAFVWDNAGRG